MINVAQFLTIWEASLDVVKSALLPTIKFGDSCLIGYEISSVVMVSRRLLLVWKEQGNLLLCFPSGTWEGLINAFQNWSGNGMISRSPAGKPMMSVLTELKAVTSPVTITQLTKITDWQLICTCLQGEAWLFRKWGSLSAITPITMVTNSVLQYVTVAQIMKLSMSVLKPIDTWV